MTFGTLPDGRQVRRITIAAGELTVSVLTLGAILQDVRLAGVDRNLTLGADRLDDYLGSHGVVRLAGRAGGQPHRGVRGRWWAGWNAGSRPIRTGGIRCTPARCRSATSCGTWWRKAPDAVTLALDLPDGEGGFPGNRRITARFAVAAPATLRMTVTTTTTDALTLVNLTNHGYWNLDGSDRWPGHTLRIARQTTTCRSMPT